MTIHLCSTCGTSFPDADRPPASCPICEDERQWIPATGQAWTPAAELAAGHANLGRTPSTSRCTCTRTIARG